MQVIEKVPIVFIVKWKGISKELKFKSLLKKATLKISWIKACVLRNEKVHLNFKLTIIGIGKSMRWK